MQVICLSQFLKDLSSFTAIVEVAIIRKSGAMLKYGMEMCVNPHERNIY